MKKEFICSQHTCSNKQTRQADIRVLPGGHKIENNTKLYKCMGLISTTIMVVFVTSVPQEVEKYKTFLRATYDRLQQTDDQWPPVGFQEYIKLATVVKVQDFMDEDVCTKAMMNGDLEIVKRMKKPIEIEQVCCVHSYLFITINPSMSRSAGIKMVHWLVASLLKGFPVLASPP